jgi:hypothetical protein
MAINIDPGDTRTGFDYAIIRKFPEPNLGPSWVRDIFGWNFGIVIMTAIEHAETYDYSWDNADGPQGVSQGSVFHQPGVHLFPIDAENCPDDWVNEELTVTGTVSGVVSIDVNDVIGA